MSQHLERCHEFSLSNVWGKVPLLPWCMNSWHNVILHIAIEVDPSGTEVATVEERTIAGDTLHSGNLLYAACHLSEKSSRTTPQ
jgi:hypothetical protein